MAVLRHPHRESKLLQKKWRRKQYRFGQGWKYLEPYCWYCIPGGSKRQILKLRAAREEMRENEEV